MPFVQFHTEPKPSLDLVFKSRAGSHGVLRIVPPQFVFFTSVSFTFVIHFKVKHLFPIQKKMDKRPALVRLQCFFFSDREEGQLWGGTVAQRHTGSREAGYCCRM